MSEWISVKDRLPKNYQEVLIHTDYGITITAQFLSFRRVFVRDTAQEIKLGAVTHWMELPELPKE